MLRLTFFPALFLLFALAEAQVSSPRFRHLTIDDGLSQNSVHTLLQDSRGYIWVGTKDGLNRYDGYTFRIFLSDPFDPHTLDNNYILALYEDTRGKLWIGTSTGLNVYDPNSELMIRVPLGKAVRVKDLVESESGDIWAGTLGAGVIVIEPDRVQETDYRPKHLADSSLELSNVRSLARDGNSVWVAGDHGLLKVNSGLETESRHQFRVRTSESEGAVVDTIITQILDAGDGYLWLGTISGLIHFRKADGSFAFFPHHYAVDRYGWGTILSMLLERDANRLWIGTVDELMLFDCNSKSYQYIAHDPQNPYSISSDGMLSMLQDDGGLIWVGSNGYGLNVHDPVKNGFNTLFRTPLKNSRINGFSVRAIFEDNSGNHWISAQVLYRWNKKTGSLQSYERGSDEPAALGNTGVWSFIEDHAGWLWMGTYEGLYRYHVKDSIVVHYQHDPDNPSSLPERIVFEVFEDSKKQIWVITQRYISLLDPHTGNFTHTLLHDLGGYEDIFFPSIHEDQHGIFWINTNKGLLQFDPVTRKKTYFTTIPGNRKSLNNPVVRTVCPDPFEPERILWLGTAGGGLNRFDIQTGEVTHLTTQDGLPDNVIYGILSDDSGHIWFSTNKGICSYHVTTGHLRKYDQSDGLQSNEFNSGAYFKSRSGEMFFGGIKGVNHFFPDDITENKHIPNIVITAVRIGNETLNRRDHAAFFTSDVDSVQAMSLSHKHDIISFEYAALDYSAPVKNRYKYKLEGWDPDWIDAGDRRIATYSNLPSGQYTFNVRGSNNDLLWNEKGTSLTLDIPPPWWASTLAYLIYGLIAIGAVYAMYRYRMSKVRLQYRLDIEHLETEQLRQLDKLKSRFFTNISHEFRTPLTLIQSPVHLLKKEVTSAEGQSLLRVIEQNAQRLLSLINEILDLSKLQAGKEPLEFRSGDIVTHLRDLTTLYDSAIRHMEKTLAFTSFAPVLNCVYDQRKVEKIFTNLISNAMKNTGAGDHITVHIDRDETTDHVIIEVTDTGQGIPAQELPYIFTQFFQGENQQRGGSGIGLALVKELVDLMHGVITVRSMPGEETTFRFTLPVRPAAALPTPPAILPEPKAPEIVPIMPTMTPEHVRRVMLIVEDSVPIRKLIASAFMQTYQILEAPDGETGEQIALEQIPDVIVTDLMMPVKDGMAMCDVLKKDERTSHIPIVMLTARADKDAMIQGYDSGADAYVVKPFEMDVLTAQISNLIQTRQVLRHKFSQHFFAGTDLPELLDTDTQWCNRLRETLSRNLTDEHFGLDQLSDAMMMSKRQIQRKCNALFGIPPNEFIRNYRLEQARRLLAAQSGTVSEICYAVGFSNLSYFSKCFKEYFNQLPSEITNMTVSGGER